MATHLTPDRRYLVVQGRSGPRLWRAANPDLPSDLHSELVKNLMNARRAIRNARGDVKAIALARSAVDQAKQALGERGPVWWTDGQPDLNRHLVMNTPYRKWWESQGANVKERL